MTKILIVDDEEDLLLSLQSLLSKDGYEITTTNSGKKALALLNKQTFDLVILDILMPEMPGTKVAEHIRSHPKTKHQKFVFLSVISPKEPSSLEIEYLNPAAYIQKPFKSAELRKQIKEVLNND